MGSSGAGGGGGVPARLKPALLPLCVVLIGIASAAEPTRPDSGTKVAAPNGTAPSGTASEVTAPENTPRTGQAAAQAAEPDAVPYTVEITDGDAGLDSSLRSASQLVALREKAPTTAFGVIGRAQADLPRLDAVLRSEGYYAAVIRLTIDGQPPDSVGLAERLQPGKQVPIRIAIEPGPRYKIDKVLVRGSGVPEAQEAVDAAASKPFGVVPGEPARSAPVLDGESTLLDRLRQSGHPLATAGTREVVVDNNAHTMDVTYVLAPGPQARFAQPVVEGEKQVDPRLLDHIAGRITGEMYSPERLQRARSQLTALGVFDSVQARAADRLDAAGNLPVTFVVAERERHAIGFTAAYETNYGPTGQVYWEHRNLFGGAERLRLTAELSRLSTGRGNTGVNTALRANLRQPSIFHSDYSLVSEIALLRQRLLPYDRDAVEGSSLLERNLTDRLVVSGGPRFDVGKDGRDGVYSSYTLLGVQFGGRYDASNSLLNPTSGYRVNGSATPWYDLDGGESFVKLRLDASAYLDLLGDEHTVLAVRGAVGSVLGATRDELPYHVRFYAGGGGSVRGYDYQSIGPQDAKRRPFGGASLVEGSVELRQRIYGNLGGVVFVDAGSVGANANPTFSDLRVGAGVGVRYLTQIGPIRADFALPLQKQPGSSGYGIYVGLGQAF